MPSKKLVLFDTDETRVLENVLAALGPSHDTERARIETLRTALEQLAGAISLYPPITGTDRLAGFYRSMDTLVDSLCSRDETEIAFTIPTKAILGKSYLMAKANFLYTLHHTTREVPALAGLDASILPLITRIVFILMAEEVFSEIIIDRGIAFKVRRKAGYLLAVLWEYRLDHGVRNFAPLLCAIWEARKTVAPVYGTLMGTSERFQLFESLDLAWQDILDRLQLDGDEGFAFDEFLFGLSFEDIHAIRGQMEAQNKRAVTQNEIKLMLRKDHIYSGHPGSSPREFYSFFVQRKTNAAFRRRTHAPGPRKTLEEHVMLYLLEQGEQGVTTGVMTPKEPA